MSNLKETLIREAERLHACRKGLRDLPSTPQGLVERWKENLDFALANDFPSTEFIRENFDRSLLHDYLVYVDEHLNLDDARSGVYVLNGECTGTLRFRSWAAATIYVRHNSDVCILAEDFAKVFVRVYDEAEVKVCEIGDSVVKVYERR